MSSLAVPVAIIGSACRFPGDSTSPSKLSALLQQPRDVRREFDPKMLNLQRFYNSNSDAAGSTNVKNQGYLLVEDSRTFDAAFFNISPVEAECMDPQLRVLLEIVYETLESAGYTLDEIRGTKTSVHVGVMASDYYDIQIRDPETLPQYAATGTARSTLSNRISYAFDLHGPSITIDTACSSSLVAVHQAVQGLQAGDATCAIVGGANLIFDVMLYIMLSNLHMLSPDSQSRMWDKTVDGYARGEGAAAVLLKPLDQALRDKDCIEGVIRATGVNSDGQSPGLTMPTVKAQAALIRETYRRAGLDPVKDRCQYFECHGTGTAAGDPIEARAISEAMIGDRNHSNHKTTNPLYVGSIKTVVGHLEGGAGLAGLLKALLSIKCRTIFPNLLFQELNPKIEPYYHGLQLPTSALPWQKLPAGDPLRASVNSFGFGGTNAHAILESYEPSDDDSSAETEPFKAPLIGPLVLSANSGSSLLGNVRSLLHYLLENPSVNLSDLSWVLQSKRTAHRVKTFFSAQSHKGLVQSMQKFINDNQKSTKDEIGTRYRPVRPGENPSILGVFTGQGAQWPTMGCAMLEKCPLFRRVLEQCDAILNALPDGPEWSVVEELSRGASTSRVGEAAISQPLCTAIQLALISVLYASGIHFDVAIGHSSGEITAVYACGIISLEAAMQIAYYRGKYAHLAHGFNWQAGAMMAVGVGYAQAQSFCRQPKYQGRVCVAASNAPQSVTLTGDSDAIQHAKKYFDENNTFARMLKVDTAYHSYHMELCADRYLKSLRACNIQVKRPRDGCVWISSVKGDTELLEGDLQSLTGPYWIQNMTQSVLFFQAVKFASSHCGPFDVAIEIGPHPALKGPTEQTSRFTLGSAPAYVGTLRRDASDVEAVVDAVGLVWSYLGPAFVDLDGLRGAFAHGTCRTPRLLKDLPPYAWDHDRVYWRESRISTRYRKGTDLPQELLGRRLPDDTDRELRWRNILRITELPWLRGHIISGEALLPGTAYISLATEAGKAIAAENPIRLIEVQDINICRPVVIPETREGLDALFTVHLQESKDPKLICGFFSYYYCSDECSGSMVHTCDGKLIIRLGEASDEELPPCNPLPPGLLPIDTEQGYSVLAQSGLLYSDTFQRLRDVRRRLNYAVGTAEWSVDELKGSYTVHPALLDVSWQTLLHARADPRAGKLPTALLPVHIDRVAVNPNVELGAEVGTVRLTAESYITSLSGFSITGDVHIYNPCSGKAAVQMEVVSLKSATPPTEAQDRRIFFNTAFIADPSLGLIEPKHDPEAVERVTDLASDIERVVLFYVQRVLEGLNSKDRTELTWYHQLLIQSFETSIQSIQEGLHPLAKQSWLDDKPEILDIILSKWPNRIDFQLVQAVGENLLGYLRRQTSMLEVVMKDDLAGRLYNDGCGFADVNSGMTGVLEQISSKFPQANYLEIGAGTGSTTDYVLRTIANAFDTYTYTDISPAFFGEAANRFSEFTGRMIFKTLDVEKDVASQGFSEHCYDVVVASNVLHATSSITRTLGNARSLLKPGGFLLLIEITGTAVMRTTFCVGGLPGWWLGAKEGRRLHPGLSTEGWHTTLQETGFSGVDLVCHDIPDTGQHCLSFMASQAVNDTLLQLREPLEYLADLPQVEHLLVIGGKTLAVSKLATAIQRLVASVWGKHVTMATDIDTVELPSIGNQMDVLCLLELDNPLLSSLVTPRRLRALQTILVRAHNVLWVTKDRRTGRPESSMMVGMARGMSKELLHLNFQSLDLDTIVIPAIAARTILTTLIRLRIVSIHKDLESPFLLTQEPELVVEGSNTLIARVRPDQQLNDRFNAKFRPVTRPRTSPDIPIQLTNQRDKLALLEAPSESHTARNECAAIKVRYSLCFPKDRGGDIYICVGHLVGTVTPVVAVSETNTSIVSIPQGNVTRIDEKDCNPVILQIIGDQILATGFSHFISNGETALLYNPTECLASCLAAESRRHSFNVLYASCCSSAPQSWIKIHPNNSVHASHNLIPQDVTVYFDCSQDLRQPSLQSALPPSCRRHRLNRNLLQLGLDPVSIQASLDAAYKSLQALEIQASSYQFTSGIEVLNIGDISNTDSSILDRTHITWWETPKPPRLSVLPPDTSTLFDSGKTYLMIGMASGLGLSICEWAVRHGMKQIVITSRNPTIHPRWLAEARRQGANVCVQSMDVADNTSVEGVVQYIRDSLPPIGGVCNAAMVLSDKLFVDMDAEAMAKVLKPKVDGSKHLDHIFSDTSLDFFIMLSSALSITGSHGQTNYHAANMFMTGLAAERRRRGLAASVIHIGYVCDVGYFTRADKSIREYVSRMHFKPISEMDVHHAFAEAILSGRPNSQHSYEIGVGIEPLKEPLSKDQQTAWSSDPRFSHYLATTHVHEEKYSSKDGQVNVVERIQQTETEAEATMAVQDALCTKLETLMQLSPGSVDVSAPLTKLGIDSLVAVEIRAWAIKEIDIDIPVTTLLGKDNIVQICTRMAKHVMAKILEKTSKTINARPETPEKSPDSVATSSSELPKLEDTSPLTTESETSLIGKEPTVPLIDGKELQKPICEVTGELAMEFSQDIVQKERMTAAQSRIYILSIIMNDPTAYSLMIRYDMTGDLDVERLRNALTATMQHHESLRTCFYVRPEDNQMMQGLLSFPVRRFKHVPEATEEDIDNEMQMARSKVWDIEHGETLGLAVLSSSPKVHTLLLSYHHIILDATGMRTFIHDLNSAYCMQPLQHDCGNCLELARKEVDSHSSGALECQLQYWQQQHHPVPDVLPLLPMAKARTRLETQQLATIHIVREIGQNATLAVKKACQTLGVTAFQFHLSVVQILLARSLGLEDLCIGVADANRHDDRFVSTVGFFLNLLPVRFHIPKDITFAQVAQNTARQVIGALENSAVPFEMILDRLNIPRSSSYAPLFQVTMNYRLAMTKEIPFGDHFLTITDAEEGRTPWDITFSFLESQSDGVTVTMDCSESLYDVEATETLLGMYLRLLEALAKDVNITVHECQIHSPEAVSETLQIGQGRQVEFDWAEAVSEKVQTMCLACPERPAVQDGSSKFTYRQFGARVNSIAAAAKAASLGVGSRIAVLCEPSNDFVASLLAILHIGAVYIPLDVSLPSTRHTAILSSCQPDLVLCHGNTVEPAEALLCEYQSLSLLRIDRIDESYEPVVSHAQPDLPAMLLYTSGSTGKPKGVVLSQGNLANWLAQMIQQLELVARPGVICQQSSLGFDASLAQIFCALCTGSSLVIVPQDSRRDSVQIARLIQEYQVTVTLGTPSEYLSWLYYGRESLRKSVKWRWACMVGEPVHHEVKREFRRLELPNLSLLNLYGPTEISFSATCHLLSLCEDEPEMGSTVGKALPNYSICILDVSDHPLPFGFQGEICIGGPGVALGYWDLPAETGRRFIPDPTGFNSKGAANRWYRTGDRGLLTSDGTLVYFGRLEGDTQIKLRGIRIELGEVEAALLKSGEGLISRAIVTVHDGVLIAHATLVPGKFLEPDSVKQLLSSLGLPQYMCPARLIIVQDLPRTSTGKIDRQALAKLPLPGRDSSSQSVSNLSLHEVELKLLWNKVLPAGDHELGPESDFFLEGGNSLQLTKLQHEIKEVIGISVSTRELYSASTLRQMAARIESQREDQLTEDEDINWEHETEIPVDLMAAVRGSPRPLSSPVTKDIEVLLTGATGFLGASILTALLGDPAIGKVHCVAIIPDELDKLPESNKIISYTGSLSLPQLGLTPSECVALQSDVDVIIHAGANGHCLNSYVSLRRPNVYSTHFLAALCLPHSIPLLYVSSPRVPSLAGDLALPPGPVLSEPSTTGDEGYMASRWVCERFLEKLSHFINFPIEVHRPCLYLGDQAPKTDAMNGVLRYTRLMKSIPRLERVRGYIDFKNVEDIAHDMVASAVAMAGEVTSGIRFRHHSSGRKVPFDKWAEYMEELYGGPYKVLELPHWIARAREEGIDPLIATYLEGVLEKKEIGVFPYLGESAE